MSLLDANPVYKPFSYPWAYDAWLMQQRIHWLPEEVPLADDVKDWQRKLTAGEKNLLSQIFRFFTQADVEVNNCYMKHYARVFKPTEVQMMLAAFSNMETVHIAAYSHLLDTVGISVRAPSARTEKPTAKRTAKRTVPARPITTNASPVNRRACRGAAAHVGRGPILRKP